MKGQQSWRFAKCGWLKTLIDFFLFMQNRLLHLHRPWLLGTSDRGAQHLWPRKSEARGLVLRAPEQRQVLLGGRQGHLCPRPRIGLRKLRAGSEESKQVLGALLTTEVCCGPGAGADRHN